MRDARPGAIPMALVMTDATDYIDSIRDATRMRTSVNIEDGSAISPAVTPAIMAIGFGNAERSVRVRPPAARAPAARTPTARARVVRLHGVHIARVRGIVRSARSHACRSAPHRYCC